MILYDLRCPADHGFQGWFRNSESFEAQQAAREIACPVCGDKNIDRALMAPAIRRSQTPTARDVDPITLLRSLRRAIETSHENVGERFAEEARKIHYGEADPRGIYGEASPEVALELADEGIEVAQVPWIPLADS